jgi:hypothetical protein
MRVTRTYLQLGDPSQFRSGFGEHPDIAVTALSTSDVATYRLSYRTVGAAYRWRDRWDWTDEEIRAHLAQPTITVHVARRRAALAGYYELRRVTEDDSVEVAYLGIVAAEFGRGSRQAPALVRGAGCLGARPLPRVAAHVYARSSERAAQLRGAGLRPL